MNATIQGETHRPSLHLPRDVRTLKLLFYYSQRPTSAPVPSSRLFLHFTLTVSDLTLITCCPFSRRAGEESTVGIALVVQ